jgi:type I restriction enzyme S subunit
LASIAGGANIYHLSAERVRSLPIVVPILEQQQRIADFLDAEVGQINNLINRKERLLELLEERIDNLILGHVGASQLATPTAEVAPLPIRRLLSKVRRPPVPGDEVITAFRDGQVTARSLRRAEGYTLPAEAHGQGQHVEAGDVVIHGLDGFSGAIGTAEAAGNCSPVYHVCVPRKGGDSLFFGRLLRVLATSGYLGLFAISTRERAVDFRNWELFGRIPVPDVSNDEQSKIGSLISSVRPLRAAIERSNTLAKERKHALITAAVTGQLDASTARGADLS